MDFLFQFFKAFSTKRGVPGLQQLLDPWLSEFPAASQWRIEKNETRLKEEKLAAGIDVHADELSRQQEAQITTVEKFSDVIANVRVEAQLTQRYGHFRRCAVHPPVQNDYGGRVTGAAFG